MGSSGLGLLQVRYDGDATKDATGNTTIYMTMGGLPTQRWAYYYRYYFGSGQH